MHPITEHHLLREYIPHRPKNSGCSYGAWIGEPCGSTYMTGPFMGWREDARLVAKYNIRRMTMRRIIHTIAKMYRSSRCRAMRNFSPIPVFESDQTESVKRASILVTMQLASFDTSATSRFAIEHDPGPATSAPVPSPSPLVSFSSPTVPFPSPLVSFSSPPLPSTSSACATRPERDARPRLLLLRANRRRPRCEDDPCCDGGAIPF